MKIIFVDNSLWGQLNFRGDVITHFHNRGCEVVLASPIDTLSNEMNLSIPNGVRHINIPLERTGTNPLHDLSYFWLLRKIYKNERPDYIFHVTIKPNIYGTLAARSLKIKCSAMVAGLGFIFSSTGLMNRIIRLLYRFALLWAHKVFVLNEENACTLIEERIVKKGQIVHLKGGEGIDIEKYPFVDNTKAPVIFLMVARMLYDKGYCEAVDAVKIVQRTYPCVKLQLLGPIDEAYPNAVSKEQIEKDERNGWVTYLGYTNDPMKIMGRPGVVLLLCSYHEGLNRSLMEGCALGKPIITSNIPGCKETVLDGENGYLVPPKDAESLARAMLSYLRLNDEQRKAMSEKSRLLAKQRFGIEGVIKEYEDILAEAGIISRSLKIEDVN